MFSGWRAVVLRIKLLYEEHKLSIFILSDDKVFFISSSFHHADFFVYSERERLSSNLLISGLDTYHTYPRRITVFRCDNRVGTI